MLFFHLKMIIFFSNQPGVLKKTDPGDGKYFFESSLLIYDYVLCIQISIIHKHASPQTHVGIFR